MPWESVMIWVGRALRLIMACIASTCFLNNNATYSLFCSCNCPCIT